ncbi:MAG TPA: hypothetical protein VHF22_03240 [Planctomycetota bacterium]|nr:hypothetical protein [Planctomycetota bacterium]
MSLLAALPAAGLLVGAVEAVAEGKAGVAVALVAVGAAVALGFAAAVVLGPAPAPLVALEADEAGLRVTRHGGAREELAWREIRRVRFRRDEVSFSVAGKPWLGRYGLKVGWGRAEDLVRLKNRFAACMAAARAAR